MSDLRTVRGPHDPLTIGAVLVAGLVLVATGALMTIAGTTQSIRVGALPALIAALLVPVMLAVIGYRVRPRPFVLWAEYQGFTVQLYYTHNEREYGQLCRALVRAREIARLGGVAAPLASTRGYRARR